ncbi:hypothetical protein Bca101_100912 [Brassica carinata]
MNHRATGRARVDLLSNKCIPSRSRGQNGPPKSCRKSRRKVAETVPPSDLNLSIIVLHQARGHYPHPFDSHPHGLSVGDFRHEDCPSVHISARWPFPWTIRMILAHDDCPSRRISARWPFRGLSGDFRHEDSTSVHISARWPFRGLSVGDFRHEDCPWVIFAYEDCPWVIFAHEDCPTLTLPVDCPGDFRPRGLSVSTHISTLALPVDYPGVIFAHEDCPWVIFAYEDCPSSTQISTLALPMDCPSDFCPRGEDISTHISTLPLPVDYPWVIFAHEDCPSVRISARWPLPWTVRVIFATRTVHQYTYQHAGPSRGLSAGDFRHEDCPWVIFATRTVRQYAYQHVDPSRGLSGTVRQYAYQHVGPSRGLSVGDFRPRGLSVGDFRPRGLSVGDFRPRRLSAKTHISTLALPVDCPVIFAHEERTSPHAGPSRGLSVGDFRPRGLSVGDFRPRGLSVGDFRPRGLSVCTHISTLTLPVDCPGAIRPRGLSVSTHISTLALPVDCPVIFATRTVHQYTYQHAGPSRGLSHADPSRGLSGAFTTRTVHQYTYRHAGPSRGLFGDFRHEDCPPVDNCGPNGARRTDLANDTRLWEPAPTEGRQSGGGACVASSPDSDLEAFSHNPAPTVTAPLAFQPSAMTNCANQRFLSHFRLNYYCDAGINDEAFGYLKRVIVTPAAYRAWLNFFTLTFRALGRNHIALASARTIAMLFGFPCPHSVLSWLFDARKAPERAASQSAPADTRRSARHVSGSSSPPTVDGFELGPRAQPSSQSFSGYGSILPTSLAYIVPSTRGCSPWRPDAVMSTTGRERTRSSGFSRARECTGHHATRAVLFQPLDPTSAEPLQGGQAICTDGRSAGLAPRFCSDRAPSYSSRPGSCPDGGYRSRASAPSIFGLVDSAELAFRAPAILRKLRRNQLLDGSISLSPYTQVRRTICTSVSLRASTRVSSGRPPGIVHHLSVPTGMLTLEPFSKIKLPYALRVYSPVDSHTCQTPWSVFQDGSNGEPTGRRPEHADAEARREARAADHD